MMNILETEFWPEILTADSWIEMGFEVNSSCLKRRSGSKFGHGRKVDQCTQFDYRDYEKFMIEINLFVNN